jgi:hypothetical protein
MPPAIFAHMLAGKTDKILTVKETCDTFAMFGRL